MTCSWCSKLTASEARWSLPAPDFEANALPVANASLADVVSTAGIDPIRYMCESGQLVQQIQQRRSAIRRLEVRTRDSSTSRQMSARGRQRPFQKQGASRAIRDSDHPSMKTRPDGAGGLFDLHVPNAGELRLDVLKLANCRNERSLAVSHPCDNRMHVIRAGHTWSRLSLETPCEIASTRDE